MAFEREAFRKPCLEPRVLRVDLVGHDADRCPAVDRLEPVEDRSEIRLVPGRVAHVVDRQHHNCLNPRLSDPLGRDQLGEVAVRVIRVHLVEIGRRLIGSAGPIDCRPGKRYPNRHRQVARKPKRQGMTTLLDACRADDGRLFPLARVSRPRFSGWPVSGLLARGQCRYHQAFELHCDLRTRERTNWSTGITHETALDPGQCSRRGGGSCSKRPAMSSRSTRRGSRNPSRIPETSPSAYAAHLAWRKAAEVARRRSTRG